MNAKVSIVESEQLNLGALFFAGFLRRQLRNPKLARRANRIRGAFGLQIGHMPFCVVFSPHGIQVSNSNSQKARACISASIDETIALVTSSSLIGAFIAVLEGRITVRGNLFALLRFLRLMLARPKAPALPDTGSLPAAHQPIVAKGTIQARTPSGAHSGAKS